MTPTPQPRVTVPATETHRAAFAAMTPAERDAHVAPIRSALASLHAQTEPMRASLAVMAEQASVFQRTLQPTLQRHAALVRALDAPIRAAIAATEKAQAVERAVIAAAPRDQRPHVRRALRSLFRSGATIPDVEAALAAVHDYLTADTFGRLFPEGRAWGLAWAFARIIRGESLGDLARIVSDRDRLASDGRTLRNRGQRYSATAQRGAPERRERHARRPAPLSNRLAAHGPPRCGAYTGGTPTPLVRKEQATA